MSRPRTDAEDDIPWLIASPKDATMTEASRCTLKLVAHDSYRRLLLSLEPSSDVLWEEVKGEVNPATGLLVLDEAAPSPEVLASSGPRPSPLALGV